MSSDLVRISKFLSLVLRHKPEAIGLTLDEQGWAVLDELIERATEHGRPLTRTVVPHVVATNAKQRFALSEDETRIRAVQGHSIAVDLALTPQEPPELLYHGTAERFLESICSQGLHSRRRQEVHLSLDEATARTVGSRHGAPAVLRIRAGEIWRAGTPFFRAENGVWLTVAVPATFIDEP